MIFGVPSRYRNIIFVEIVRNFQVGYLDGFTMRREIVGDGVIRCKKGGWGWWVGRGGEEEEGRVYTLSHDCYRVGPVEVVVSSPAPGKGSVSRT